jgi:hypothetical protein
MSDVPDLTRFAEGLKLIRGKKVKQMCFTAVREAMKPVQKVTAAQYAQKSGKFDMNQSETALRHRWGGGRHNVGESRRTISRSIMGGPPKVKTIRGSNYLSKIWGQTNNSFLIEVGRYKDVARSYKGWGLMSYIFNLMSQHTHQVLSDTIEKQLKVVANQFWKEFARKSKPGVK